MNNLQRACKNNNIQCAYTMLLERAVVGELVTEKKLMELKKVSKEKAQSLDRPPGWCEGKEICEEGVSTEENVTGSL